MGNFSKKFISFINLRKKYFSKFKNREKYFEDSRVSVISQSNLFYNKFREDPKEAIEFVEYTLCLKGDLKRFYDGADNVVDSFKDYLDSRLVA